jgi:hypothetical protein
MYSYFQEIKTKTKSEKQKRNTIHIKIFHEQYSFFHFNHSNTTSFLTKFSTTPKDPYERMKNQQGSLPHPLTPMALHPLLQNSPLSKSPSQSPSWYKLVVDHLILKDS